MTPYCLATHLSEGAWKYLPEDAREYLPEDAQEYLLDEWRWMLSVCVCV